MTCSFWALKLSGFESFRTLQSDNFDDDPFQMHFSCSDCFSKKSKNFIIRLESFRAIQFSNLAVIFREEKTQDEGTAFFGFMHQCNKAAALAISQPK